MRKRPKSQQSAGQPLKLDCTMPPTLVWRSPSDYMGSLGQVDLISSASFHEAGEWTVLMNVSWIVPAIFLVMSNFGLYHTYVGVL